MSSVAPTPLIHDGPFETSRSLKLNLGPQVARCVVIGTGDDEKFSVDDNSLTFANFAGAHVSKPSGKPFPVEAMIPPAGNFGATGGRKMVTTRSPIAIDGCRHDADSVGPF